MKDETYAFISDVKDKKITARSARNMRTHCGKGGRVRLPSDNLSKKELQKMSGECKSYKLNEPMGWEVFMSMPDDIKVTYIKLIREKFGCPDSKIGTMMGADKDRISRTFKKLGLNNSKPKKNTKWDKEGFWAWVNGVDKLPTPAVENLTVTQEDLEDIEQMMPGVKNLHIKAEAVEEPETFVEEDLPWDEPDDPIPMVEFKPCTATPCNGSMTFKCPASQALNTLAQLLGDANVNISVMWRVVEEGEDDND